MGDRHFYLTHESIAAASDLLLRDYWTRLWPIQEILLARQLVAFIGSQQLSWTDIKALVIELPRHFVGGHNFIPLSINYMLGGGTHFKPKRDMFHRYHELAKTYVTNECSDPRHKLYGLMSVTDEGRRPAADYSASVQDVYIAAVALIMNEISSTAWLTKVYVTEVFVTCLRLADVMLPLTERHKMNEKQRSVYAQQVLEHYWPSDEFMRREEGSTTIHLMLQEVPKTLTSLMKELKSRFDL